MIRPTAIAILSAAALSGCASNAQSPSQMYRAKGQDAAWRISGNIQYDQMALLTPPYTLTVYINGVPAITGKMARNSMGGEYTGRYDAHDATALCSSEKQNYSTRTQCVILIDNERAATLVF